MIQRPDSVHYCLHASRLCSAQHSPCLNTGLLLGACRWAEWPAEYNRQFGSTHRDSMHYTSAIKTFRRRILPCFCCCRSVANPTPAVAPKAMPNPAPLYGTAATTLLTAIDSCTLYKTYPAIIRMGCDTNTAASRKPAPAAICRPQRGLPDERGQAQHVTVGSSQNISSSYIDTVRCRQLL
jgi:hypothetical protein